MFRFKKGSKYKNHRVKVDGINFDSKAECNYYFHLLSLKEKGEIKKIETQPKVYLSEAKILYKPDFLITKNDDSIYYVDVKGMRTSVFQIKMRLWKAYRKEKLILIKKTVKDFKVLEEIN